MYLLGYSLNNLTLMALTISTGFVVDDAIVMIENIVRYIEEGETPREAALKGASQIGFTIISLTVSLIAVLIPLLFMGDIVGRLFREFAVTLERDHPGLGGRLADADADDVLAALEAQGQEEAWPLLSSVRTLLRAGHRLLRSHTPMGAEARDRDAARRRLDARLHRAPLPRGAEGLFPGAGHRRDPGDLRGVAEHFVPGDG